MAEETEPKQNCPRDNPDAADQEKGASPQPRDDAKTQRAIRGFRWFLVCLATFSCNFLYGLDNTIVADIQDAVIQSFGEIEKLGWLGIGFPLGSLAIILPIGKAYGIFDIKWLYIGSLVMFAAGSALCGAAPNKVVSGQEQEELRVTVPQERSIFMSIVVLVYGVGAILGPVIGGSLADSSGSGWRWAFYLNLFIFAAMTPIYFFLLPSYQPQPHVSVLVKLMSLDWAGVVLSAALYTAFAMVFTFGGSIWSWDDGRIIALFVVCGILLVAFIIQQLFSVMTTKERRIFPCQFVRDRTLVLLFICSACLGGALFVTIYYIPLYFQFVDGDNGIEAAVRLLPFICFYIFSVILNGWLMPRFGYYLPWYLTSGIFTTIGGALKYTTNIHTSPAESYGYSILIGIGMTTYQAAYSVATVRVAPEEVAAVIQYINVAQQGSILIALTICSAIFQDIAYDRLINILGPAGYSTADIQAAIAGARSKALTSAPADLRAATLEVLISVIGDCYLLVVVSGALLIICAACMHWERLHVKGAVAEERSDYE